ncbi:hypothetical protein NL499_29295, partial [Klebsiella pneumoniae]|nr:hypothetical protein [Klebsiella pneumoniae]
LKQAAPHIRLVGVFMNASPEVVTAHVNALPLDVIQLHGSENPKDYGHLGKPLIKTLLLEQTTGLAELHQACQSALS